jgi:hypothetical protein
MNETGPIAPGVLPRRPAEYASAGKVANLDALASATVSRAAFAATC